MGKCRKKAPSIELLKHSTFNSQVEKRGQKRLRPARVIDYCKSVEISNLLVSVMRERVKYC